MWVRSEVLHRFSDIKRIVRHDVVKVTATNTEDVCEVYLSFLRASSLRILKARNLASVVADPEHTGLLLVVDNIGEGVLTFASGVAEFLLIEFEELYSVVKHHHKLSVLRDNFLRHRCNIQ